MKREAGLADAEDKPIVKRSWLENSLRKADFMTSSERTESLFSQPWLGLSDHLREVIKTAGSSVVAVMGRRHYASSGLYWQDGIIVTASHTLEREEEIAVQGADLRSQEAVLIGRDPTTDLAILRVESTDWPRLPRAEDPQVGELVLAVARSPEMGVNASLGMMSAVAGSWHTRRGGQVDQWLRPDLRFYSGFSGGALLDWQGKLLGMNTAGLFRRLEVTLPVTTLERVVTQLLEKGHIVRGYLGVGMQAVRLPTGLVSGLNLPSSGGVIIVSLETAGPADQAGILIGDVMVSFAGIPVADSYEVVSLLTAERVGHHIPMQVVRGGSLINLAVTVAERPRHADS
ncbi:MAG: S1C family serine protease [Cyanobacteriota bacterium]|nr:S1C family serine protease [Cyanobacteriota bacterium]